MILHTSLSKRSIYTLPIVIYQWEMHHSKEWYTSDEIPRYSAKKPTMKWECSSECKILMIVMYVRLLTLTLSLLVERGLKNE